MTNMTNALEVVLKTDELGRVRTPVERREKLLDEFERSGLSGAKFAALAGIKYPTFAGWALRRRRQEGSTRSPAKAADQVRWLEAMVAEAAPSTSPDSSALKVHLPGGAWIEVARVEQVELAARLVRSMEKAVVAC
jgi:hypothetical protein